MGFERFLGKQILIRCIGIDPRASGSYLEGHTDLGIVSLQSSTASNHSGTWWTPALAGTNTYTFRCLGQVYDPSYQFLNGDTSTGAVTLTYAGTHWQVTELETDTAADIYTFQSIVNNSDAYTYLHGSSPNAVNLVGNVGYTAQWHVTSDS